MSVPELLASADRELSYVAGMIAGRETRTVVLSDGEEFDLLVAAVASARSRLVVALSKVES